MFRLCGKNHVTSSLLDDPGFVPEENLVVTESKFGGPAFVLGHRRGVSVLLQPAVNKVPPDHPFAQISRTLCPLTWDATDALPPFLEEVGTSFSSTV